MSWAHFTTLVWLRWRIRVNQMRRGGTANVIILGIVAVGLTLLAGGLLVGSFLLGRYVLEDAPPGVVMLVWDGLVVAFLTIWTTGLVTALQRSEAFALDKFLHLPVSLGGIYSLNYLSSLPSLGLALFLPASLGLAAGLVAGRGATMLWLFPAIAAFVLMVTALTYQFQGWLASLMANPRRRRTIVVVITTLFVTIAQLPNIIHFVRIGRDRSDDPRTAPALAEIDRDFADGKITEVERDRRKHDWSLQAAERRENRNRQKFSRIEDSAWVANVALPPGWLPLAAAGAAQHMITPALLGTAGMALIGAASLWRGYRTTVRLYRGEFTGGSRKAAAPAPKPEQAGRVPRNLLVERRLPWVSEPAAAIATAGLRSLLRAPEAKMLLLTPVILLAIFGGSLLARSADVPAAIRPFLPLGGMATVLFSLSGLVGNQFGFDRDGFRVFVLCGARRRDILLGKNLAVAPLALTLGLVVTVFLQAVRPMQIDQLLATLPQLATMYLLFCLSANAMSIAAPTHIPAGSLRASKMRWTTVLYHLGFALATPLVLAPALVPPAVEFALERMGLRHGVPVYLILSPVALIITGLLYYLVLEWEGEWLHDREQQILEVVTSKTE